MTLSPKILAAIKKVDLAHAELFAALEDEARRKRPSRNGREKNQITKPSPGPRAPVGP
jgi:hypothetical protein